MATGIGAAAVGAAGLAASAMVAGPVGVTAAMVGGAVIGGYVGKAAGVGDNSSSSGYLDGQLLIAMPVMGDPRFERSRRGESYATSR